MRGITKSACARDLRLCRTRDESAFEICFRELHFSMSYQPETGSNDRIDRETLHM